MLNEIELHRLIMLLQRSDGLLQSPYPEQTSCKGDVSTYLGALGRRSCQKRLGRLLRFAILGAARCL